MPCQRFYRVGRSLEKKFSSDKFVIVGVNCDPKTWVPKKLASTGKVTWRNFQAEQTVPNFREAWGMKCMGVALVVDPTGVIQHIGLDYEALPAEIEKTIGESNE